MHPAAPVVALGPPDAESGIVADAVAISSGASTIKMVRWPGAGNSAIGSALRRDVKRAGVGTSVFPGDNLQFATADMGMA